ncbi:MAG: signal peptidase I [Verrucomicrobiales bacterium]|nr:signal peptidase I [Verrucomicrobiales bacterium]
MNRTGPWPRLCRVAGAWWRRHGLSLRGTSWLLVWALMGGLLWVRDEVGVVVVVGDSMLPTLRSGDVLFVHRGTYDHSEPMRGDIVVARYRSEWIVKRVVGLPGESVEVIEGAVQVNGSPVSANHAVVPGRLRVNRGALAPDRFAVLGDNRAASDGLLFYAVVPRERLMGRVVGALHLGAMKAAIMSLGP